METAQVGTRIVKMSFFKVRTGTEAEVVLDIRNKLKKAKVKNSKIFKVFGTYDLLIIYEPVETQSFLFQGVIPNILSSIVFDCFTWRTRTSSGSLVETFNFSRISAPLLGIIFFKMKSNIFQTFKGEVFLKFMNIFSEGKDISALGCFGWSDAILLVSGNSIVDLIRELDGMVDIYIMKGKSGERLALKTFSFVTVDFSYCAQILRKKVLTTKSIIPDTMKKVYASLAITCRPDSLDKIMKACAIKFKKKPAISIGKNDLLVEVKNTKWPSFLKNLLNFRKHYKGDLISTSVQICGKRDIRRRLPVVVKKTPIMAYKLGIDKFLDRIPNDDFGKALLSNLYTLNQFVENYLIAEDICALIPFLKRLIGEYLSQFSREELDHLIQIFQMAVSQRLMGANVEGEDFHLSFHYPKSGIQKVLTAIEVIPRALLSRLDIEWRGFVVVGGAPDYRHDLDIINIPGKIWSDPSAWWGIFHEIGHIYALNKKAYSDNYLKAFIKEDLNILPRDVSNGDELGVGAGKDYGVTLRYLMELIADAFDYRYGFISQENLYLDTVWGYLVKEHADKLTTRIHDYIGRTLGVFLINKMVGTANFKFKGEFIEDTLEGLLKQLKHLGVSDSLLRKLQKEDLINSMGRLKYFLEHVSKNMFQEKDFSEKLLSCWGSNQFKEEAEKIRDGYLCTQKIEYPHLLILHFVGKNGENPKLISKASKVALIKTLWFQNIFYPSNVM